MAAPQMFSGLKALAARAGIKLSKTDLPNTVDDDEDEAEAGSSDDDEDGTTDDSQEGGDGNEADGETGEDGDEGESDEGDGGEAEPQGQPTQAKQRQPKRSAEFRQGERYGRQQEAGRFAAVLASPVARANLEMATDLLASSSMTPQAIIEHCDRYKGESSAKRLLDTTPKVKLGVEKPKTAGDAAQGARKNAVETANKRQARTSSRAGAPVRKSRRAAAAAGDK